jgi:hypothetical protein
MWLIYIPYCRTPFRGKVILEKILKATIFNVQIIEIQAIKNPVERPAQRDF